MNYFTGISIKKGEIKKVADVIYKLKLTNFTEP